MEKFCSAKTQSAALKQFIPRDHSTPSSFLSREQSLPRKEPSGRSGAKAVHSPPTTVWGARCRPFPRQRPHRRVDLKRPNRPVASAPPSSSCPSSRNEESRFTATRRGQTAKAYLPASNALSSLRSVTTTSRGLVCRTSSPSFFLGLAVGGRVRLSPSAVRHFAASGPCVRGHSRFSPAGYGPRADHLSVQHFTLHQHKQGRRGLCFVVEGVTASKPSRHPNPGMSSFARHSASSIAFHSRMGASTGGIALGVLRTVRSSYPLQFGRNPPRFDGVQLTVVNSASKASVLQQELSSLLQKGAIEEIPQSDFERGFFSRYFHVPKRDGGLRPILDLRRLNFSLYKGKFKMLTMKTIMSQIQGGDWFVTIDLKDAYFHIQVVQRHRRFLRFAFGGKAYHYKFLPFGLALEPRTFTKCMDAALAPLRLQGIRVLNYLDDWLILAHSRELVSRHRDIVLRHIHSLGLRMNAKKSVLLPSH